MPNIYGPPGVGRISGIFPEGDGGSGVVLVRNEDRSKTLTMLVQSWSYNASERVQENHTLSETEHIYTFGHVLPKISITALVVHKKIKGKSFLNNYTGGSLRKDWEDFIRARKSGEQNKPLVLVQLDELEGTFKGVATGMSINKDLSNEAFLVVNLAITVLKEMKGRQ